MEREKRPEGGMGNAQSIAAVIAFDRLAVNEPGDERPAVDWLPSDTVLPLHSVHKTWTIQLQIGLLSTPVSL